MKREKIVLQKNKIVGKLKETNYILPLSEYKKLAAKYPYIQFSFTCMFGGGYSDPDFAGCYVVVNVE